MRYLNIILSLFCMISVSFASDPSKDEGSSTGGTTRVAPMQVGDEGDISDALQALFGPGNVIDAATAAENRLEFDPTTHGYAAAFHQHTMNVVDSELWSQLLEITDDDIDDLDNCSPPVMPESHNSDSVKVMQRHLDSAANMLQPNSDSNTVARATLTYIAALEQYYQFLDEEEKTFFSECADNLALTSLALFRRNATNLLKSSYGIRPSSRMPIADLHSTLILFKGHIANCLQDDQTNTIFIQLLLRIFSDLGKGVAPVTRSLFNFQGTESGPLIAQDGAEAVSILSSRRQRRRANRSAEPNITLQHFGLTFAQIARQAAEQEPGMARFCNSLALSHYTVVVEQMLGRLYSLDLPMLDKFDALIARMKEIRGPMDDIVQRSYNISQSAVVECKANFAKQTSVERFDLLERAFELCTEDHHSKLSLVLQLASSNFKGIDRSQKYGEYLINYLTEKSREEVLAVLEGIESPSERYNLYTTLYVTRLTLVQDLNRTDEISKALDDLMQATRIAREAMQPPRQRRQRMKRRPDPSSEEHARRVKQILERKEEARKRVQQQREASQQIVRWVPAPVAEASSSAASSYCDMASYASSAGAPDYAAELEARRQEKAAKREAKKAAAQERLKEKEVVEEESASDSEGSGSEIVLPKVGVNARALAIYQVMLAGGRVAHDDLNALITSLGGKLEAGRGAGSHEFYNLFSIFSMRNLATGEEEEDVITDMPEDMLSRAGITVPNHGRFVSPVYIKQIVNTLERLGYTAGNVVDLRTLDN